MSVLADAELAREVAVKVMGWEKRYAASQLKAENRLFIWADGDDYHVGDYWVVDWGSAGRVIEKMRANGWKFSLVCDVRGPWSVIFWPSGEMFLGVEGVSEADTGPRAIMLAALRAKETVK